MGKKQAILSGLGISAFILFVLILRLTYLSSSYCQQGLEAYKTGDREKAFLSYTWAIRNYYPGNPYVYKSIDKALEIIKEESAEGKKHKEMIRLQDLRAALYSIHSIFQPCKDSLQLIEEKIKQLRDEPNQ